MKNGVCKWLSGDCPACADGCPALNYPEICKYFEEAEEKRYE